MVAPVAVDAERLGATAASADTDAWRERLRALIGERRTVVRVERADPAKNAVRALQAFELVLERRPELATTTCMLAVLTPHRTWIPNYRRYFRACERAAERINRRFGAHDGPVRLHSEPAVGGSDHHRALAALELADVLAITSTFDGFNIVAMEGAIVGDASLVLSRNTGAYSVLSQHALPVNPFDVVETADAFERGLDATDDERASRASALRHLASARTPHDWVNARLAACR